VKRRRTPRYQREEGPTLREHHRAILDRWAEYHKNNVDIETAIHADVSKQNVSFSYRPWYVEIHYKCRDCGQDFVFSATEQKVWHEDYGLWIEASPKCCPSCRAQHKRKAELKRVYDSHSRKEDSGLSPAQARGLLEVMLELFDDSFSPKVTERLNRLSKLASED
jgi:hypothetical protein